MELVVILLPVLTLLDELFETGRWVAAFFRCRGLPDALLVVGLLHSRFLLHLLDRQLLLDLFLLPILFGFFLLDAVLLGLHLAHTFRLTFLLRRLLGRFLGDRLLPCVLALLDQ